MNDPLILAFGETRPRLDPTAFVAPGAVVVGDVTLGPESSLWFGAVVRGDEHPVVIGARTNIQDLTVCHETSWIGPLTIGDDVTVGHRAILHGCTIGDRCMIGMGAILLDGCEIGAESIVAAGAVVPERMIVPPRSLVAGVPAVVKRALTESDLKRITKAAKHYVERAREYAHLLK